MATDDGARRTDPVPVGGPEQVWGVLWARRKNADPDEIPEIKREMRRVLLFIVAICVVSVLVGILTIR